MSRLAYSTFNLYSACISPYTVSLESRCITVSIYT